MYVFMYIIIIIFQANADCLCKPYVTGDRCDTCKDGHFNLQVTYRRTKSCKCLILTLEESFFASEYYTFSINLFVSAKIFCMLANKGVFRIQGGWGLGIRDFEVGGAKLFQGDGANFLPNPHQKFIQYPPMHSISLKNHSFSILKIIYASAGEY